MKNLKKISIITIIIALLVVGLYKGAEALYIDGAYGDDKRTALSQDETSNTQSVNIENMSQRLNNVYCIEHGQNFQGTQTFNKPVKVVINGNVAQFYTFNNDSKSYSTLAQTVTNKSNNILAAILTPDDLSRGGIFGNTYTYGHKMVTSHTKADFQYTDAQLGVYAFLNEWIEDVGATSFQFEKQADNVLNDLTSDQKNAAQKVVKDARSLAEQYTFKVTIYLLKSGVSSNQSVITTYPEGPLQDRDQKEIPVTKIWKDNNNRDKTRPESIAVKLYKNDTTLVQELKLTAQNNWTAKFTNLEKYDENKKEIEYTIKETTVPGYATTIIGTDNENGFTIVNTYETVNLVVTKEWDDDNNKDGIRPDSVKLTLYADGKEIETVTVTGPEWTYKFTDLPRYNANGEEIIYTIDEKDENIPNGYTKITSESTFITSNITKKAEAFVGKMATSNTTTKSSKNGTDIYDNHLLDALKYFGVDIDGMKNKGILYKPESTKTENRVYRLWGSAYPYKTDANGINWGGIMLLGDETIASTSTVTGLAPDMNLLKSNSYYTPCNSFINYYYFNYLPNIAGVDTSWMLYDKGDNNPANDDGKYFERFENVVEWSWPYDYAWINGWRKSLDWMSIDGLVERYSIEDMNTQKEVFGNVHWKDVNQVTVDDNGIIEENDYGTKGQSVWEQLVPGDILIFTGTVNGVHGDDAHMAIFAGKGVDANGNVDYYYADISTEWGKNGQAEGSIGFWSVSKWTDNPKIGEINTWYHFKTPTTEPKEGTIIINKVDTEGNKLEGAEFTATHENGTKYVSKPVEGEKGKYIIENVPYGKITVVETVFPYGYTKSDESQWNVTLDENTPDGTITIKAINRKTTTLTAKIINQHAPDKTELEVIKKWDDKDNASGLRPTTIIIKLLANKVETGKEVTLSEECGWSAIFTGLDKKDSDGKVIDYTVKEEIVAEYEAIYDKEVKPATDTTPERIIYTVTNKYDSEKTEVKVIKQWDDKDDFDEIRPTSIKVHLLANGVDTGKSAILNEESGWTKTFTELNKYEKGGKEINYTVEEEVVEGYEVEYDKSIEPATETTPETIIYTLKNKHEVHYEGYFEITGKVWLDGTAGKANDINGTYGEEDTVLEGIKVTLKDANGAQFDATSTTYTGKDGNYVIKVNYDNTQKVYKLYEDSETVKEKMKTAYVEFEYDGIKYTTVKNANKGVNTSKAIETETQRNNIDTKYSVVTANTTLANEKVMITARTKGVISFEEYVKVEENIESTKRAEVIKYCNGDGTYTKTYWDGAWKDLETKSHNCTQCNKKGHVMKEFEVDVDTIKHVNLGLFEREQPDVALFTDIRKVEVDINNQRYSYMYGVDTEKFKNDITTKFQNEDYSTYRMPVNPADVASLNENKTTMDVYVTYEITVGNLSNTLTTTVDEILNDFDPDYTIENITYGVMNKITGRMESVVKELQIPNVESKNGYNQIILSGLGITVKAEEDELDEKIYIRYKISQEQIKNLFAQEAPLNNASEINKYSTQYGIDTLYAEQRTGERAGKAYGGYDYNSHPGNAEFYFNQETNRLDQKVNEDDDDISPAFVLCKEETAKTLSGTIWEDTDVTENSERLGNGKDDASEKRVQNVKVELYNIDGTPAKLYNKATDKVEVSAVTHTNENGEYSFEGVVTGEYFIKYTYGKETTMDGGRTTLDARNYKSTIITDSTIKTILSKDYEVFSEEDKKWHITHEDGHSVAVDNMKQRLEIPDLQYDNFDKSLDMIAYSKPFKTQVEFEATGSSQVDQDGNIEGVSNELNKLDFGIIERPRENLIADKTISYIKITLANGQVLTEGDPRTQNLNYIKSMGIKETALDKQLLVEIDNELIQGAHVDMQYVVKVTNNNEVDYDYGTYEDYKTQFEATEKFEYDKYIVQNPKANYYYYGDKSGLDAMKTTIEFIDYLNKELVLRESDKWEEIKVETLYGEDNKLISEETYRSTTKYIMTGAPVTLQIGESFEKDMSVGKVLSNKEANSYDNNIEIIQIDGKTARTIEKSENGEQKSKLYKPGNYVPSLESGIFEQDDDRVKVIITPPTGITNNITIYIITAGIGLAVIIAGIIFIKKKVLIK